MEKSPKKISATTEHPYEQLRPEDEGYISDDFEFSVASSDPDTSDEVSGPIFPVFNRDIIPAARSSPEMEPSSHSFQQLLIRDRADQTASASSSPDRAKIGGSPVKSRKSSSTGSSTSNSWGLREIVGKRSHSDGREKFVLLERPPPEKPSPNPNPNPKISASASASAAAAAVEGEKGKKGGKTGKATEMDMVTAHRLFYGKGSGQGTKGSRRTYLPYRQELLMGFFANGTPH